MRKPPLHLGLWLSSLATVALTVGCAKQGLHPDGMTPLPGYAASPSALALTSPDPNHALRASPPGSVPALGEEVWIVARTRSISSPDQSEMPRQGSLVVERENTLVPLPLKHTDVQAAIHGYIASVTVVQQYQNPFEHKIEARYVFPLPENAAVDEFIMIIGDRRIRGIIRDRAEAERIYQDAKAQGYVASLLTEERPNIFTQSVANIEPGKQIDVRIHYFHTLAFDDGWHELVFPMVVGPRFNPAGSKDGIRSVAREAAGTSGQKTEVQYLAPAERSGHDISLAVELHGAVPVEQVVCRSHQVSTRHHTPTHASITLSANDAIPNKDFVLRYRVSGEAVKAGLLAAETERGGFFSLVLYPPVELRQVERQPLELVFVLDCSGSMDGVPIQQARAAVRRGLQLLRAGDSFQLINFSMSASQLGQSPLDATPENVQRGLRYIERLDAEGGTMMIEGIKAALDFPHDPERLRFVCFLTDGFIGNETDILTAVKQRVAAARIFSFGVGSSPNRYLLDSMARLGRGAVAYLSDKDDGAAVMNAFFERIRHPGMIDLKLDWPNADITEAFPARLPDLFVGRAVTINGRFRGQLQQELHVLGKVGSQMVRVPVRVQRSDTAGNSLASVWARAKIASLTDESLEAGGNSRWPEAVRQVALDFNLVSAYTAFVAVDASAPTTGEAARTVPVAVPVPAGLNYDKTVTEP
jgi:Ca-activated chloride channel homolog